MDSTVYVNDIKIGEWKYGYSTFEYDITNALMNGQNEILVHVINQTPNSRWYSGAGIYRNVWLKQLPKIHFSSDGIYISTVREKEGWKVKVSSEVVNVNLSEVMNESNAIQDEVWINNRYIIRHTIFDDKGIAVAETSGNCLTQELTIHNPQLWDMNQPNLYELKSELVMNGRVIHEEKTKFGFRSIRFDSNSGFYLNDRHVKLHGVCMHHDLGALGAAVNRTAIKRQLELLKEMGVNAIRTAHNMCAVELMELADEMGFLIVNEAFDMWERPKNTYDYARFFKDSAAFDVMSWVRRDRNHPCNIMWSIGNEIYDTHAGERGLELTRYLMNEVLRHDPEHNAYVTLGSNYMPWENTQKCADILKLAGYNYAEKYYDLHHKEHRDWIIYGSETASVVQSRGIYHFPLEASILCEDDEQCSSLGNSVTSWGARSIEKCITDDRDAKYSAGMFIWSGFDYIGEPTPYHTKNSYFGQLDTAGFKKDSFYVYQAEWTYYKTTPMIHVFPYWDFNEGQLIDVRVCSNAPRIELFFNDISQGQFEIDHEKGHKLIGDWRLPYHPGELRAVAYDEMNHIIAEDVQRSFHNAAQIVLTPDKQTLQADGQDLLFVEISMKDQFGNPVSNANNRVHVKVTGAGRLIGLDNGDSTDYDSYKGTSRRLFSGKLLAIIAAKTVSGMIELEVTSEGIPTARTTFTTTPCDVVLGVSANQENTESTVIAEIPVRKLEIVCPRGTSLHEELREVEAEVKLYPENATYSDITWRVTNAAGVDTNIAKITQYGYQCIIQAIGDGIFFLRASIHNGKEKPNLISILEFHIHGMGKASYNPYEFLSGSLYTKGIGEITSGNERGAATARDGETILVYERLDFGTIGSDEITIPIFELESKPTKLELWEGDPSEEGSELLADVIYDKKSIWNTYQEETYHLKKRLQGITTIAFLLRSKVHIKGFQFTKPDKAYETILALSYNTIYGDDYYCKADYIENIGNNVTIAYEEMDFGLSGTAKLILCGRCTIDNSILVSFKSDDEIKQMIEFPCSDEFIEREYDLKHMIGIQKVEFIFLPGCKFDFKWYRFEKSEE